MIKTKKTSMPLLRKSVFGFCVLSSIGLMSVQTALADCTRHFVNRTDKEWRVAIIDNNRNTDWVRIGPNQTVSYEYISSLLNSSLARTTWSDYIVIKGPPPENYDQYFNLSQEAMSFGDCVYINHVGNTGSATVNEPASGDLIFWRAD